MDLRHFHLQVKNLTRSRRFYEDFFEFLLDEVCDEHEIFLKNPKGFVLGLEELPEPDFLPDWFHFGFAVDSETRLRTLYQEIVASEVKVLRELKDFGSSLSFFVFDPDGNRVEVYHHRVKQ